MPSKKTKRRLPVGAEPQPGGGVHFRVWAPRARRVFLQIENGPEAEKSGTPVLWELEPEKQGYFSLFAPKAGPGTFYRYCLDKNSFPFYDPVSRFQPQGSEGPSEVIDPEAFAWTDKRWRGAALKGQVIYELHVGSFTREGTWEAAERQLPELAALGITLIEVMPVADFPGKFGWGYDGVNLFAPTRLYGRPDDFRSFVDAAHRTGIGVILDVVYNHLGPSKNYLKEFSPDYFSKKYETEWGDPMNFDGPNSGPVREFYLANATYWIDEFHLDGLRLDATQNIYDDSPEHILDQISQSVRKAAKGRRTLLVGENEPQNVRLLQSAEHGGYGLDALWNDDFHHAATVALTGRNEAYYSDYLGTPQELISSMKRGFLYQGQWYMWQKKRRGTPTRGLPGAAFITFIQNHDQVANSFRGARIHELTDTGRLRAITALMLLGPGTPMLFMGQEFAASAPFLYFADQEDTLSDLVYKGRSEFLRQFRSLACPEIDFSYANPSNPETFMRSKLDFADRDRNPDIYNLHRDLLRIRREDPVFSAQRREFMEGAVLGPEAFLLRWFAPNEDDRLLLIDLGRDLHLHPAPEPLLAPPFGKRWAVLWSSEDPRYGGCGTPSPDTPDEGWRIPGHAAVILCPQALDDKESK